MKARSSYSLFALGLALATSAAVAGAQVRTSATTVVCRDGTTAAETRGCYFHGGADAQATQRIQTTGRYGTYPSQSQQNGSWKVGTGQGNGSWKAGGQPQSTTGRYDDRYDRRYDERRDRWYDRRREEERYERERRREHHDNGKHLGWYKNGKHHDRDHD